MWWSNAEILWEDGRFHRGQLHTENGVLVELTDREAPSDAVDLQGRQVWPGLIDLHIHGYAGIYVMEEDAAAPERLSRLLAAQGVTSYVPTTTAGDRETLLRVLRQWAAAAERPSSGAVIRGLYMEGPFLSPRYKGAMREECVCAPELRLAEEFRTAAGGWLRLMTVAPELPGAEACCSGARLTGLLPQSGIRRRITRRRGRHWPAASLM